MSRPSFALSLVVLLAAAACGTSSDGTVTYRWSVKPGCSAGQLVQVSAGQLKQSGNPIVSRYACSAGGGSMELRPGTWSLAFALLDASGHTVASSSKTVDLGSGATADAGSVVLDTGGGAGASGMLSWSVVAGVHDSDCGDSTWLLQVVTSATGQSDVTDRFACLDHAATIARAAGAYTVSVTMLDKEGSPLTHTAQQSVTLVAGQTAALGQYQFTFGAFDVSWTFTKGGARVACDQIAGADTVRVTSTGAGRTFIDDYNCGDEGGVTGPIPEASYSVSFDVLDQAGHKLNPATPQVAAEAVSGVDTPVAAAVLAF